MHTVKKIFPEPLHKNYFALKYDKVGLYSITHQKDADIISQTIIDIIGTNNINIIDMNAGCGGNTISFMKYFSQITAIEIDTDRFKLLKNNVEQYVHTNIKLYCDNCVNYINNSYDVIFFDPPWGGPDYKKYKSLDLYLSNINLINIIDMIPHNKLIVLKLPYNYNFDILKNYNVIKKLVFGNVIVLFMKHNYVDL